MTKTAFKKRWESTDDYGGITFDNIAECAKAWGIAARPRICSMDRILYQVLKAASVKDAEEYRPED